MKHAKDVEEYIAHAPEEIQEKLRQLQEIIKSVAPTAEEKISYGMAFYAYKGPLVYFGIQKKTYRVIYSAAHHRATCKRIKEFCNDKICNPSSY